MDFADSSSLMLSNGTMIKIQSTFVSEGTLPAKLLFMRSMYTTSLPEHRMPYLWMATIKY